MLVNRTSECVKVGGGGGVEREGSHGAERIILSFILLLGTG